MNRAEKESEVANLGETIGASTCAFLLDFKGLNVERANMLRGQIRRQESGLRVVKNRLAKRALADTPFEQLDSSLVGQTAIAFTSDDAVGLAKLLSDFSKEHEVPTFRAGVVDGQIISPDDFEQLASLPSREELLAKLLYVTQSPIVGVVTVLSGVMRNFVGALDQIRQQKED